MPTYAKNHRPDEIVFDTSSAFDFVAFALAASQANTTVQTAMPIPCNFKIHRVVINLTGAPAGTCSFNVVAGTGAETGLGTKDTVATSGVSAFASDQALTMTANTPQVFTPGQIDTIYPNSLPLTIRVVTNASGAGTLQVILFGKFQDSLPTKPLYTNYTGSGVPSNY